MKVAMADWHLVGDPWFKHPSCRRHGPDRTHSETVGGGGFPEAGHQGDNSLRERHQQQPLAPEQHEGGRARGCILAAQFPK